MQNELLHLKNLGNTSVNWLRAIGVRTQEDLVALGAVDTYNRIRQRGFRVSKVLLYALEGALLDVHWNDLTPEHKERLVEQAESDLEPS
jgi:DNA transformation protein